MMPAPTVSRVTALIDPLLRALEESGLKIEELSDSPARGWIDTGNFALNWAISGRFSRGWPLGHLAEIFGDPSTGKTYVALNAMREVQKVGGWVLLDDSEGSFNLEWAERLGVNVKSVYTVHSTTVKQHSEVVKNLIKSYEKIAPEQQRPGLIVLDSLGQLSTEHETETGIGTRDMSKALEVKAAYRLMSHAINKYPIAYIATNHTYANVGNIYQPRVSSSGSGLKYSAGVRLDLRTPSKLKNPNNGLVLGVSINAYVEKSRFTSPWRSAKLNLPFFLAIQRTSGLLPILIDLGVVQVNGRSLIYKEQATKIKIHKSDILKQDYSAALLLEEYPEVIAEADAAMMVLEAEGDKSWKQAVEDGQGE